MKEDTIELRKNTLYGIVFIMLGIGGAIGRDFAQLGVTVHGPDILAIILGIIAIIHKR